MHTLQHTPFTFNTASRGPDRRDHNPVNTRDSTQKVPSTDEEEQRGEVPRWTKWRQTRFRLHERLCRYVDMSICRYVCRVGEKRSREKSRSNREQAREGGELRAKEQENNTTNTTNTSKRAEEQKSKEQEQKRGPAGDRTRDLSHPKRESYH